MVLVDNNILCVLCHLKFFVSDTINLDCKGNLFCGVIVVKLISSFTRWMLFCVAASVGGIVSYLTCINYCMTFSINLKGVLTSPL